MTSIGDYAFTDCRSLTSVTIPDSVTGIGSSMFSNCSALVDVTVPDSVLAMEALGFEGSEQGAITFHCASDSAAQSFAEENGFNFVAD